MNIAFLTSEYPHSRTNNGGGIGTSIKNLAHVLSNQVNSVTVFVISSKENVIFYDEKVRIVCIEYKKYSIGGWYFYRKFIEKKLNEYFKLFNIDIIEIPDWTGISAFMKLSCPIVIKIHGSDTYFCHLEKRKQKWKNYWFESLAFKNANAIIGVSKFSLETTVNLFKIQNYIPKLTIYNGINVEEFQPTVNVKDSIVLYFGTLIRKKGSLVIPLIFNEVQKIIPNSKLILIGSDSSDIITGNKSTWEMMTSLFNETSFKHTEYKGKLPYEDVKKIIDSASVCIFPSYAEAFSMVILEAMAMEKIVVCADMPWVREIIDNGINGFYSDLNDINKFAKNICIGFEEAQTNIIGKNARKKLIELFDIEKISENHIEFYQKIINK